MNFLNPWFAAGVAAVVIPALLVLYFLKLRRREELVPSTLLWRKAVQDLQVNAPFQRLRKSLLLLLQLLILALAVLALARPIIETTVADAERVVLLIDRSASMNAIEEDQSRLDRAKNQAALLAQTFNRRTDDWWSFLTFQGAAAQTQVMVIAFGEHAAVVSPYTTNTTELVHLIDSIAPTDERTDLREALNLAEAYMAPPTRLTSGMEDTPVSAASPARVVLISDGRIDNLDQVALTGEMSAIIVGEQQDNVGITTLRTQRNYEQPEILNVFLTVENFGPEPVATDVSLYIDGTLETVKSLQLAPPRPAGQPRADDDAPSAVPLAFQRPLDRGGVVEVRLSREDALAADNVARVVVAPPRRQRVLVVTSGNLFLDAVLRGLPLAERRFVTPAEYDQQRGQFETDGQSDFDVVIFDKVPPVDPPAGNFICLGTAPELPDLTLGEPLEPHTLIWWDETHPILRHVALDHVYVGESRPINAPDEAEVLIEGPAGPTLVRYSQDARQYLVLGFPIERSTWWSKPSFPVFVYNAIRYLGGGGEGDQGPVRPGATLRIPLPAGTDSVRLTRPDGQSVRLVPDAAGRAYYGGTNRVGLYRVSPGLEGRDAFAVNLEDRLESDIAPREQITVNAQPVAQMEMIKTETPEVWRWFVGAALVLLIVEWWIYNRKVML
jgi:hypothetical protein